MPAAAAGTVAARRRRCGQRQRERRRRHRRSTPRATSGPVGAVLTLAVPATVCSARLGRRCAGGHAAIPEPEASPPEAARDPAQSGSWRRLAGRATYRPGRRARGGVSVELASANRLAMTKGSEIWNWTRRTSTRSSRRSRSFSSMTGYVTGTLTDPDGVERAAGNGELALERRAARLPTAEPARHRTRSTGPAGAARRPS